MITRLSVWRAEGRRRRVASAFRCLVGRDGFTVANDQQSASISNTEGDSGSCRCPLCVSRQYSLRVHAKVLRLCTGFHHKQISFAGEQGSLVGIMVLKLDHPIVGG